MRAVDILSCLDVGCVRKIKANRNSRKRLERIVSKINKMDSSRQDISEDNFLFHVEGVDEKLKDVSDTVRNYVLIGNAYEYVRSRKDEYSIKDLNNLEGVFKKYSTRGIPNIAGEILERVKNNKMHGSEMRILKESLDSFYRIFNSRRIFEKEATLLHSLQRYNKESKKILEKMQRYIKNSRV